VQTQEEPEMRKPIVAVALALAALSPSVALAKPRPVKPLKPAAPAAPANQNVQQEGEFEGNNTPVVVPPPPVLQF
jgi:hypothetical protein